MRQTTIPSQGTASGSRASATTTRGDRRMLRAVPGRRAVNPARHHAANELRPPSPCKGGENRQQVSHDVSRKRELSEPSDTRGSLKPAVRLPRRHDLHSPVRRSLAAATLAMRRHRTAQDLVMAGQRSLHRLPLLIPQPRRSLKIREQKRHRPGREIRHPEPLPSRPPKAPSWRRRSISLPPLPAGRDLRMYLTRRRTPRDKGT